MNRLEFQKELGQLVSVMWLGGWGRWRVSEGTQPQWECGGHLEVGFPQMDRKGLEGRRGA